MKIEIQVEEGTPAAARRALAAVQEIEVTEGLTSRASVNGKMRAIAILGRDRAADPKEAMLNLEHRVVRGKVGLVVGSSIPYAERDILERRGMSWCDGRGALHLEWPGVLVHIDRGPQRRVRIPDETDALGIGPAGIRAIQVLIGSEEAEWSVGRLAEAASVSTGQAHNVFRALERNRLVELIGKGPRQRRVLKDRLAALDWLAMVERARRRPPVVAAYLYARSHKELLARFAERADKAKVNYAITGAAASDALGVPVLSNIVVTQVRIASDALEGLRALGLERLEAEDAGRGANLELWTDIGEVGTYDANTVDGIRIAPSVRVWLDMMRLGGRNDDAARLFREHTIDRA